MQEVLQKKNYSKKSSTFFLFGFVYNKNENNFKMKITI